MKAATKLSRFVIIIFIGSIGFAQSSTMTLADAISEGRNQSPKLLRMQSVAKETSWKKVESYSGYLPSLNLSAQYLPGHKYMLTDIDFGAGEKSIPQIIPTSNIAITAVLPLFDGFTSTNQFLSASAFSRAAEQDLRWTEFQLDHEVTLQFYKVLGSQILKQVAEQNVKMLEDHVHDVSLFKKAGVSTNYDVLKVEVQVSEAKTELLNAVDNIDSSRQRLSEILGKEVDARMLTGDLPSMTLTLIEKMDETNLSGRYDLAALENKTEGFKDNEDARSRYWIPHINAIGQYQYYNNINDRFNDQDSYREAYQVGLNLTWTIFDGAAAMAKSKQSIEQKYQSEKTLIISRLKAKQEISYWKRKFIYFCSVYKSRTADVAKAIESLRLAREGRRVGARTNTDLLDSEAELFRAKAGQVNSQMGAIEALVNFELTTGQKIYQFN